MEDKKTVVLQIAQIPLRIFSNSVKFIEEIRLRYQNFVVNKYGKYKIKVWITNNSQQINILPQVISTPYGYDILCNQMKARFKCKNKEINLSCPPNHFLFNSFLRILLSVVLSKNEGFLLHSAGIKKNNKGRVFFGMTGAGKTTLAEKFSAEEVLSDDVLAVKVMGGKVFLFGTPFSSAGYGGNYHTPCEKIFYLIKDKKNFTAKLSEKDAFRKILSCILFFGDDIVLHRNIFRTVDNLLKIAEVVELHFTKNVLAAKILGGEKNEGKTNKR